MEGQEFYDLASLRIFELLLHSEVSVKDKH